MQKALFSDISGMPCAARLLCCLWKWRVVGFADPDYCCVDAGNGGLTFVESLLTIAVEQGPEENLGRRQNRPRQMVHRIEQQKRPELSYSRRGLADSKITTGNAPVRGRQDRRAKKGPDEEKISQPRRLTSCMKSAWPSKRPPEPGHIGADPATPGNRRRQRRGGKTGVGNCPSSAPAASSRRPTPASSGPPAPRRHQQILDAFPVSASFRPRYPRSPPCPRADWG